MGEIRKENLHQSLIEYLDGLGLTEEQVNELIENGLVEKVGEINGLMTTEKGSLVGAINELFQSANNGKELIANAIGEPVSADDTFSAMSNDINGLLSTFKTNMMNNGITVESNDRFKSLIDKIATMVEEGSGKGIQFATGTINNFSFSKNYQTLTFDANIGFIPTYFFIHFGYVKDQYGGGTLYNFAMSNIKTANISDVSQVSNTKLTLTNITETGFSILGSQGASNESMYSPNFNYVTWYAIGVGEEDNTLRDSLASILQEEGVSVTNEDSMASLISKVDEEFTKDNNTINNLTNELAGKVTPAGTAVAANVLSGKTFINSTGQTITGTMANMSTHTQVTDYVAWNTDSIYLGIPTGAYVNASSTGYPEVYINKTRLDSNLVPENIVSGKSICGVWGSAKSSVILYPNITLTVGSKVVGVNTTSTTINVNTNGMTKILLHATTGYGGSSTNLGSGYIIYPDTNTMTIVDYNDDGSIIYIDSVSNNSIVITVTKSGTYTRVDTCIDAIYII